MDAMTFIVVYKMFSEVGNEHTEILMLLATLVYIAIDVYFMLWISSVKSSLPPRMATAFSDAILGYTDRMKKEMYANVGRKNLQNFESGMNSYADVVEKKKK